MQDEKIIITLPDGTMQDEKIIITLPDGTEAFECTRDDLLAAIICAWAKKRRKRWIHTAVQTKRRRIRKKNAIRIVRSFMETLEAGGVADDYERLFIETEAEKLFTVKQ